MLTPVDGVCVQCWPRPAGSGQCRWLALILQTNDMRQRRGEGLYGRGVWVCVVLLDWTRFDLPCRQRRRTQRTQTVPDCSHHAQGSGPTARTETVKRGKPLRLCSGWLWARAIPLKTGKQSRNNWLNDSSYGQTSEQRCASFTLYSSDN